MLDLKNFLMNKLPLYMIPNEFVFLDSFPTTPNGKIDKIKLQNIELNFENNSYQKPQTETEKKLFDIVSELAQNTNFGITTDFFTIGLDSLNIIQISSKIIEEFNIEIAPSQLYKLLNI